MSMSFSLASPFFIIFIVSISFFSVHTAAAAPERLLYDVLSDECNESMEPLMNCVNFISNGGRDAKPTNNCCVGLEFVLQSYPNCTCVTLQWLIDAYELQMNITYLMSLPSECKLDAPSIGNCTDITAPATPPATPPTAAPTTAPTEAPTMASPSPSGEYCSTFLHDITFAKEMANCADFVMIGREAAEAKRWCCSALETVVKSDAKCSCVAFKEFADYYDFPLDFTKISSLPSACNVHAPSMANCGNTTAPTTTPTTAPTEAPTTAPTEAPIVAPTVAPSMAQDSVSATSRSTSTNSLLIISMSRTLKL
ncbi:unnamed protein product [Cochlearia groenlandica]